MTAAEISMDIVEQLADLRAALRACVLFSGKPLKEVALDIDVEVSHLSKMLNASPDQRHFPPNKITDLMRVCGNQIPLLWLCHACGYPDPRKALAMQAEIDRLRSEVANAKGESRFVMNVFKTLELKK